MRVTICTQISSLSDFKPLIESVLIALNNTNQTHSLTWDNENGKGSSTEHITGSRVFLDGNEITNAKIFEQANIVDIVCCQNEEGQGEYDIAIESITFEDNETQIIIEHPYSVYGKKIG